MTMIKETGQVAYEARFADARPREVTPWADQADEVKAFWARVESAVDADISRREGIEWLRTKDIDRLHDAEAEVARLTAENDHLRASLANSGGPCPYCNLPKDEWAKCASGFPGCSRADDAMLCPNVGASFEADAEVARLTAVVEKALDDACRMDAIRLAVGELSPNEIQLASIVAGLVSGKVRAALHGGDHAGGGADAKG